MRLPIVLALVLVPTAAFAVDTDSDGIDDEVETYWGLDPTLDDSDKDGLLDSTEWSGTGTPPDFDGDGKWDPIDDDDDNDGIGTEWEVLQAGLLYLTDPHLQSDVDGDGILDGEEWLNWLDPDLVGPACVGPYSGHYGALDQDKKPWFDVKTGAWSCAFDGFVPATDVADAALVGDDFVDCATTTGQTPDNPWDRDCDGLPNFIDLDDDGDGLDTLVEGLTDTWEACAAYGKGALMPGDGIPNYLDRDSDGDDITTTGEAAQGNDAVESDVNDSDKDSLPDVYDCEDYGTSADSDGDGLLDDAEISYCDAYGVSSCWLSHDTDSDGLPDSVEFDAVNHDDDTTPDLLDDDDDNDGVPTAEEAVPACDDTALSPKLTWYGGLDWWCVDSSGAVVGPATFPNSDAPGSGAKYTDLVPDYLDLDDNGDGVATPDNDPNNNGILSDDDSDNDEIPDWKDPVDDLDIEDPDTEPSDDQDGDGIKDSVEGTEDLDGDGLPNNIDPDADGDGASDQAEGDGDKDNNGVPDFLDAGADGVGEEPPAALYGVGCQTVGGHPEPWLGLAATLALALRRAPRRRR